MVQSPDETALALIRLRDPRGFDLAYAAYSARVYAFVLRLSKRRDLAEDLLQQTFLRLAERGPELRADSDLKAWLFTVAHHAFVSQVRVQVETVEGALEMLASPPANVEARLLLGDVEHALGELRVEDRELLLLVGVEGLAPSKVASIMGIDPSAARQRLARARARLLSALERSSTERIHSRKSLP